MATSKQKTYEITARLVLIMGTTVKAESVEEALVEAKKLTTQDFVSFESDCHDGSIAVTSVTKPDSWDIDQTGL